MKPSQALNHAGKILVVLSLLLSCTLLLSAQSSKDKDKKTNNPPPPPPPKTSTPAPAQKPAPPPAAKPAQPPVKPQPPAVKPPQPQPSFKPSPPTAKSSQPSAVSGKPSTTREPYVSHSGDQTKNLPGGRTEFRNANGQTLVTNTHGQVQRIEAPRGLAGGKMVINRGPRGGRIVETGRPGARLVSYGPHRGFVERPLRPGYISRTYVAGGRSYARVYREYRYRNFAYYRYVPAVYYGPRFYVWAVTPWGVPVRYAWFGIAAPPAPWFGFYAGYFTPYPTYASADLWLTDYLIAENLRLAYENQQADSEGQPPAEANAESAPATLSPEMKALVAEEVRQQLAEEKAAAALPASFGPPQPAAGGEQLPPALNQRFFVVTTNLDITTSAGEACSVTPGDILERKSKEVSADGGVAVEVVTSKRGDCAADSAAALQLADLQEMHNRFREQVDSGLKTLAENQAKGLPSGPAPGTRGAVEGTADPVSDADAQLAAQDADAAKVEAQVKPN